MSVVLLFVHTLDAFCIVALRKYFPIWMHETVDTATLKVLIVGDYNFELFKQNRYDRELGGVYLHWSQVGKTLFEVFRDEHAPKMTDALCSEINHQKYYSGEFDVEWGQTITEHNNDFKKQEMTEYRKWLDQNNFDWEDPKLSLGYIKLGQVDLDRSFGDDATFKEIHNVMASNLNITSIEVTSDEPVQCEYPYTLDGKDWQKIQIESLRQGYESRGMC